MFHLACPVNVSAKQFSVDHLRQKLKKKLKIQNRTTENIAENSFYAQGRWKSYCMDKSTRSIFQ